MVQFLCKQGLLPRAQNITDDKNARRDRFVLSIAYSPDGSRVAAGVMDGAVVVFDTGSGAVVQSLKGHYKPVRHLAFTPGARTKV